MRRAAFTLIELMIVAAIIAVIAAIAIPMLLDSKKAEKAPDPPPAVQGGGWGTSTGIIIDTKTGKRFVWLSTGNGVAMCPIEEAAK